MGADVPRSGRKATVINNSANGFDARRRQGFLSAAITEARAKKRAEYQVRSSLEPWAGKGVRGMVGWGRCGFDEHGGSHGPFSTPDRRFVGCAVRRALEPLRRGKALPGQVSRPEEIASGLCPARAMTSPELTNAVRT